MATWNDLREAMLDCDSLRNTWDHHEGNMTLMAAIDETIALWQCLPYTTADDYMNREDIWNDELADVLAANEDYCDDAPDTFSTYDMNGDAIDPDDLVEDFCAATGWDASIFNL